MPSRLQGTLAVAIIVALIIGGWYTIALLAAIAMGGLIALFLYNSRHGEL